MGFTNSPRAKPEQFDTSSMNFRTMSHIYAIIISSWSEHSTNMKTCAQCNTRRIDTITETNRFQVLELQLLPALLGVNHDYEFCVKANKVYLSNI